MLLVHVSASVGHPRDVIYKETYVAGSKIFRSDIQKPRQMKNAVRDI